MRAQKMSNSPVLEVGVDHSVGETFAANTDTFEHTVTSQLVHDQVRVDDTFGDERKKKRKRQQTLQSSRRRLRFP